MKRLLLSAAAIGLTSWLTPGSYGQVSPREPAPVVPAVVPPVVEPAVPVAPAVVPRDPVPAVVPVAPAVIPAPAVVPPREPVPAAVPTAPAVAPIVPGGVAPAAVADTAPAIAVKEVAEPLTRGPVHEALAQAVTPAVLLGLTAKTQPPPLVDELPPSQRPAGKDIVWIPGYWGWDDELNDFIWISGIWRAIPPGREWVPGYWVQTTEGFQWISGYWGDVRNEEVEYLPAPPETVDAGPRAPSPTGNEIWIPGCWMWQQNKYIWRAGYWAVGNSLWIWTNAHYVYTPRGYLFVSGYWDFLLQQRGILFTPVHFRTLPANYVYTPHFVVNTAVLINHLFLRPAYRHYYYGDYYAANYRTLGILPYFVFRDSRHGFDSLYSFYHWHHRTDPNWARVVETQYQELLDREDRRPPRTYSAWLTYKDRGPLLVSTMQDYTRLQGQTLKFSDVNAAARQSAGRYWRDLDTYRQARIKLEAERALLNGETVRVIDRVRVLKPPTANVLRDFGPGEEERHPVGVGRPVDAGRTELEGKVPGEVTRNPREVPGPLNDIRERRANPPKGPIINDPDGDGRPGVKSLRTLPSGDIDLPAKTPTPVPGVSNQDKTPVVVPKVVTPPVLPPATVPPPVVPAPTVPPVVVP